MKKENKKVEVKKTEVKKPSKTVLPLADRVLVMPIATDDLSAKTESGIIIPDTVSKEKPEQGKVIAVGEGKYEDGKLIPVRVKVGDRVLFSKYGFDEIKIDGEELYILKEDNILAIIK